MSILITKGTRRSSRVRRVAMFALLTTSISLWSGCSTKADLVVLNATVYTMDEATPTAQAFAVSDGRFVAVGDSADIASRFRSARIVDAGGAAIIPGLIDSHGHLVNHGIIQINVDLRGTTSIGDVLSRLKEREGSLPEPWRSSSVPSESQTLRT